MNAFADAFRVSGNIANYCQVAEGVIERAARGLPPDEAIRIHYDAFSAMMPSPLVPDSLLEMHLEELAGRVAEGHYNRIGYPTAVEIAHAIVEGIADLHAVPANMAGAILLQLFGEERLARIVPADAVEAAKNAASLEDREVVHVLIERYSSAGMNRLRQTAFNEGVERGWPPSNGVDK